MSVMTGSLCGVWVDHGGRAHLARAEENGTRREDTAEFRPFAWLKSPPAEAGLNGITLERLAGEAIYGLLAHADSEEAFDALVGQARQEGGADVLRPMEVQFLLQQRLRLYADMTFAQLRRCQLDIETASSPGSFSDPRKQSDRVLAIGLRCQGKTRLLVLAAETDEAEKRLLEEFNLTLAKLDPDVIEGHNLFKFDLDFLRRRCRRHRVPCQWGRFGQLAGFRNSRLKVAERWVDYPRCDLPGRAVVDTYLLTQLYDITTRELNSYGLKEVAVHFGITPETGEGRTYIAGADITDCYRNDRARFEAYLADDLRETAGLADVLLPTYFEQTRVFPLTLQDATLRGTAGKVDLLFLEKYYHARQACPQPPEVAPFAGGYTRSFETGVFRHVLHYDVASLYPSLLLQMGRKPRSDVLGVFIPLLQSLRDYRLKYKQLARSAETAELRAEYSARQAAFKILINSFYGYLGFGGARFGDGELAAEVTRRGRELLQGLIDEFQRLGCTVLEADTDGIYLSSPDYFEQPEALLQQVTGKLPEGIALEHDGNYQAMFCYKAKNYALYDGHKTTVRGSALRSRGIEPYLRKLTGRLIGFLVGEEAESPAQLAEDYRRSIAGQSLPVAELARSEILSQDPDAYAQWVSRGGKPRRASAEVALQMQPRPKMGDRISYFITPKGQGAGNDWQRASPLSAYDARVTPYDPQYYLAKLDDWEERYGEFIGLKPSGGIQGELL